MLPALITPAIGFVSRHWKALALGAVGLAVAIAFLVLLIQRNDARSDRDAALERERGLLVQIDRQNAAVEAMRQAGEEARQRSERALADALEANRRDASTIEGLRRSGARVRQPGERCEISPELRQVEGL